MKDCKLLKKNLIDFTDQNMSPELMTRLTQHLESCPTCRKLVEDFAAVWTSFDRPEEIKPSVNFWAMMQDTLDAVDESREKTIFERIVIRLQPIAVSAAILVAIALGYNFGHIPGSMSANGANVSELWDEYYLGSFDDFPSGSLADTYFDFDVEERNES